MRRPSARQVQAGGRAEEQARQRLIVCGRRDRSCCASGVWRREIRRGPTRTGLRRGPSPPLSPPCSAGPLLRPQKHLQRRRLLVAGWRTLFLDRSRRPHSSSVRGGYRLQPSSGPFPIGAVAGRSPILEGYVSPGCHPLHSRVADCPSPAFAQPGRRGRSLVVQPSRRPRYHEGRPASHPAPADLVSCGELPQGQ